MVCEDTGPVVPEPKPFSVTRVLSDSPAPLFSPLHSTAKGAVRVVRKSMLESAPHHEILMAFATHCLAFRNERLQDLELLYHLLDNDDLDPARGIDAVRTHNLPFNDLRQASRGLSVYSPSPCLQLPMSPALYSLSDHGHIPLPSPSCASQLRQHFLNYVKELGAREVKRVNDEARLKMASPSRPDLSLVMASPSLPANYVSSDAIQVRHWHSCSSRVGWDALVADRESMTPPMPKFQRSRGFDTTSSH